MQVARQLVSEKEMPLRKTESTPGSAVMNSSRGA
jgi:hypothetical protein